MSDGTQTQQAKAAPTEAPKDDQAARRGGADGGDGNAVVAGRAPVSRVVTGSGRQTADEAKKEREALAPRALGPGSGTRIVREDGSQVDSLKDIHSEAGETIVTINDDVYEEFPAPGAPNRKIKKLLFHVGQQVPKSVLARHEEQLKANADEVERLAALGRGTGHPDDVDLAEDGETKEGRRSGSTKEGRRGRVTRRS